MTCPTCGAAISSDARFCMSCGAPQPRSVDADRAAHARVAGAAPPGLAEKMRTAVVTGERKPVTAVFGDVVGSTTLAESMDPEDWVGVMNRAFDVMSRALYRYEGTIASLIGDGILAFFGAPVAHEDDPERAVLAALAMVEGIEELGTELRAAHGLDFRIRVGINTGEVVVGNVGSDLRYEYTALGDTMNVAARMESAAPPGGVLVTADTHRFVRDRFETEDQGEIRVKGRESPVHAFQILGRIGSPRPTRGVADLTSELVGRDEELSRLDALVTGLTAEGGVAVLSGEPGIGKSRLLTELRARSADGPAVWAVGQCLSYGVNLPYHLIVHLLRSLIGMPSGEDEHEIRAALRHRVTDLFGEADSAAEYLEHLMSLPQDPEVARHLDALDPAGLLGDYVDSLGRLLKAASAAAPLVLVCEDVHWVDASSVELLARIMREVAGQPILWLWTRRPQAPPVTHRLVEAARTTHPDTFTEIALSPLTSDDSRQLVANLLEIDSLPASLRDSIVERSDGNPFFVEEVIRMLIERGALLPQGDAWVVSGRVDAVEIPDTLHGLLLARIDALPAAARRALLVASVIGRTFAVRVLERVLEPA